MRTSRDVFTACHRLCQWIMSSSVFLDHRLMGFCTDPSGQNSKLGRFWFCQFCLTLSAIILFFVSSTSATSEINPSLLNKLQFNYGPSAVQRIVKWQKLLRTGKALTEPEKLLLVNNFINQHLQFADDRQLWGYADYWATPVQSLAMGAGDCEDYSIAKYFTLKQLGVSETKMRLTYVKAIKLNQAHMVLTYFATPKAVPLVLDNLDPVIKSADKRKDLVPVYSFNGMGLWVAKKRGQSLLVGDSEDLDLWSELKHRMLEQSL